MSDLAKLWIWDDPAIFNALSWYLDVAENRRPAKFRIAATVAAGLDPAAESEDALWAELERLTRFFWRAGGRSAPARGSHRHRTDQASWSYAASSHTACLAIAISVRGIAASTA
jgi:hypothetical protein